MTKADIYLKLYKFTKLNHNRGLTDQPGDNVFILHMK